jgi:DNA-binding transcriptional LysR family regulator
MDLRQLEYLIAVDEHGSFTKAARAAHVSQPSLSTGIRGLETELGVVLFTRVGRTVVPTAACRQVVDSARQVLRDVADLSAAVAAVTSLTVGTLDLVALPTLAVDPLATLIGSFRLEYPGVTVRVHEPEDAGDVERSVRSGLAELGLTDITTGGSGLQRIELYRQEIVVVQPPDSVVEETPMTPGQLAQLPLIVTPEGTSTRRMLDRMLDRHGLRPNVAVEINHREAIVPLVLAGAGSALLPMRLAREAATKGAMVRTLRPTLSRRIGLLHRPTQLSPAAQAMIALAVAAPPD